MAADNNDSVTGMPFEAGGKAGTPQFLTGGAQLQAGEGNAPDMSAIGADAQGIAAGEADDPAADIAPHSGVEEGYMGQQLELGITATGAPRAHVMDIEARAI